MKVERCRLDCISYMILLKGVLIYNYNKCKDEICVSDS